MSKDYLVEVESEPMEHKCRLKSLVWEREVRHGESCIYYRGYCKDCGKWWDEVYTLHEGYFDVGNNKFVSEKDMTDEN